MTEFPDAYVTPGLDTLVAEVEGMAEVDEVLVSIVEDDVVEDLSTVEVDEPEEVVEAVTDEDDDATLTPVKRIAPWMRNGEVVGCATEYLR